MDAALLKEREAFKKRALAQPTVEKKVRKDEPANKKAKLPSESMFNCTIGVTSVNSVTPRGKISTSYLLTSLG